MDNDIFFRKVKLAIILVIIGILFIFTFLYFEGVFDKKKSLLEEETETLHLITELALMADQYQSSLNDNQSGELLNEQVYSSGDVSGEESGGQIITTLETELESGD